MIKLEFDAFQKYIIQRITKKKLLSAATNS